MGLPVPRSPEAVIEIGQVLVIGFLHGLSFHPYDAMLDLRCCQTRIA
jgi:hypothetical protein